MELFEIQGLMLYGIRCNMGVFKIEGLMLYGRFNAIWDCFTYRV